MYSRKKHLENPSKIQQNMKKPKNECCGKKMQIFSPTKKVALSDSPITGRRFQFFFNICPGVAEVVGQGVNSSRFDTTKLHGGRKVGIERGQPSVAESLGRRSASYSFSHNHGSGSWLYLKGNCYDLCFTSMFMGGRVSSILVD